MKRSASELREMDRIRNGVRLAYECLRCGCSDCLEGLAECTDHEVPEIQGYAVEAAARLASGEGPRVCGPESSDPILAQLNRKAQRSVCEDCGCHVQPVIVDVFAGGHYNARRN